MTGYLDSAARNMGMTEQPEHDERYRICEEYISVMYKLWNASWRDDAVIRDTTSSVRDELRATMPDYPNPKEVLTNLRSLSPSSSNHQRSVKLTIAQGIYTHSSRVREINHSGKYFTVPGPHICAPSPQRTPVIMQAGTSRAGQSFAAKHAEAIFVSGHSPASVAASIASIRAQAKDYGRDPASIKFLTKITTVLGRTTEEAKAKYAEYMSYGSYEGALALFGGWTGVDMAQYGDDEELNLVSSNAIRSYIEGLRKHAPENGKKWTKKVLAEHIMVGGLGTCAVGTPEEVADEMERWVREADVDGFNIVSCAPEALSGRTGPIAFPLSMLGSTRKSSTSSPVQTY